MEITDSNILRKMQSRIVSKDVFDFDRLTARPLLSMLDYSDLDKLYNIASSIRYSGDIQKKLNAIRDVMHARGFRKLSQGTNRIVYSCYEDPTIVMKIATDKVGMKDNPREFLNQEKLKPFVTKVFEVTPDGVVGEVERVQPITSREEFLSCSDEAFGLLNLLTRKYILADFGSKYFMNFGIRNGFGIVLLDYPYLYEVDGNKLVCKCPNFNEPGGVCGGWIDYDPGFNDLVCTKCGVKYKAIEIAKGIEENKIIRKGRQTRMKVAVNWKGQNKTKEVSLDGQLVSDAFKTPTPIVRPAVNKENVGKLKVATPVVKKEVKEVAVTADEVKVVEKSVEKVEQVVETPVEKVEEVPVVEEKVVEKKPEVPQKKVEDRKTGLKVKVTTQDGKTVESSVDHSSNEEESKKSNMKVNNNPVSNRHYKSNHDSNMPRKSQIQLTAITFEQLKELDFKYRSIDLEFHKMFFEAKHEKSNPSISVDFDSIPKEKLVLIAGNESPMTEEEITVLKEELEKAKHDLNETEEALTNLRKMTNGNNEVVAKLQEANVELENANKDLKEELAAKDAEIENLRKQLEELQVEEVQEPVPEEDMVEDEGEYEDDFDSENFAFIYGTWQYIDDVCDANGFKKPENLPFDSIVTLSVSGDPEDDLIKDQDGKIICMGWLNGHPVDNLDITPREQVVIGQVEEQSTEE